MASTARVQAWRAAVAHLRTFSSATLSSTAGVSAALSAAVSQLSTNVTAVFELPPNEVASDMILLIQSVPIQCPASEAMECSILCVGTCRLISDVSSRVQLEYKTDAVHCLVCFLRKILEGSNIGNARAAEEECSKTLMQQGAKAEWEALKVLVQVIHDHGAQLSAEETGSLLSSLLRIAEQLNFAAPGQFRINRGSWHGRLDHMKETAFKSGQEEKEHQRLVFTAISNLFIRAGTSISKENVTVVIKALRSTLESMSSTKLVEDAAASRSYAAVLRCVHLVLSEARSSTDDHVVGLVGALRAFFMYGLNRPGSTLMAGKSGISNGLSGSWGDTKSKSQRNSAYRSPHMRRRQDVNSGRGGSSDAGSDVEGQLGLGCLSSDSDLSDSDGLYEEGDRFKSSKVRTSAVLSIQALARSDPKALHAHWLDLLPTHDVLQPWPFQATLLTLLIFDPVLKVRMAAGSTIALMLEGPSRAYLQVAEHKEITRSKSFTTLSSSLGQLVIQVLTGLVHVITAEGHSGILILSFKALSLLLSASPFSRLPGELLPYVVSSVHLKIRDILLSSTDQCNVMCAGINCVAVALSCTPPSAAVAAILVTKAGPSGFSNPTPAANGRSSSHILFPDLISSTYPPTPAAVRVEAFQALKAAVHTYPFILSKHWELLSHSILKAIEYGRQHSGLGESLDSSSSRSDGVASSMANAHPARFAEDKVVNSAIKLLDEFLRATCGYQGTEELPDDGFSQPLAPISVSNSKPLLSDADAAIRTPKNGDIYFEMVDSKIALMYWMEALRQHLPAALAHPAPMVRSAALTCFAGLTSGTFSLFSLENQGHILTITLHAARNDDTPLVRSAACRAIGVVMGIPQVTASMEKLDVATDVIIRATTDAFVAVRITASWALANICDALRNITESASVTNNEDHAAKFPLEKLAECAIKAAEDSDKVRANAVRALGNLARFANFGVPSDFSARNIPIDLILWKQGSVHGDISKQGAAEANKWLEVLVQTLMSCVTTGNVKVQWNVCHALGNLFLNKTIRLSTMTWVSSVYSILLLLLRDSANFKIRIHSAAALAVPESREDYGESYNDVLKALVHAWEGMDPEHQSVPTSFRYNQALSGQLTTTVLHVLGLASPHDFLGLKDFLLKKSGILVEFLSCACASGEPLCGNISNDEMDRTLEVGPVLTEEPTLCGNLYDERPLPLPKEHHRRYGLQINDPLSNPNRRRFQGLQDSRKAARALADMYRYGGVTDPSQKLEILIDKPWH